MRNLQGKCPRKNLTTVGSDGWACKVSCKNCNLTLYDEMTDDPMTNPLGIESNKKPENRIRPSARKTKSNMRTPSRAVSQSIQEKAYHQKNPQPKVCQLIITGTNVKSVM